MAEPAVDFDVIVVGAGIAGCVTAYQLAQAGHDVLVVERGSQPDVRENPLAEPGIGRL